MKDHGINMLRYDYWANIKLLDHIDSLSEDLFHKQMNSVFPSIAETFYHIFRGQRIWIKRCIPDLAVNENIIAFNNIEQAKKSFKELHQIMIDSITIHYDGLSEIVYQNTKGTTFKNHIDEIMHHLANHGTYHRGNIASMIRDNGYKGTSTDYIQYLRDLENK
ncbi:DinB family protein [Niallia oryzisoli]|uniref:DinB family protein n=1 Tax=Niallia oryzisoli TaxID=1737571 RepID=A0ABZ2C7W3_9BACI